MENIEWLGHASFKIKDIYIDPYQIESTEPAKIILITHSHFDHCSPQDIQKIATAETTIVAPADCLSKLRQFENSTLKIVGLNSSLEINGIKIETVPAYNIDKNFHPKANEWFGFIITVDNQRIYHAGDTDLIPEMDNIQADIALLPIGGTYTMNIKEAAEAAKKVKAKIVIPMHYNTVEGTEANPEELKTLLQGTGIQVSIL